METALKTKKEDQQEKAQLSAAISLAIDIKATFEMYAYRIIDHNTYILRTKELVEQYKYATK